MPWKKTNLLKASHSQPHLPTLPKWKVHGPVERKVYTGKYVLQIRKGEKSFHIVRGIIVFISLHDFFYCYPLKIPKIATTTTQNTK